MAEEDKVIGCDCIIPTKSRRNWTELRLELLELILKRLALVDMARFELVSLSWYAAAKSYISSPVTYKPLVPQTPWLLLPRERIDVGRFFSLSEKTVYTIRNLFEGFAGERQRCLIGSSYGWLVMKDVDYSIHLHNPISRVTIILPPLKFCIILRVFLSSDPSCSNAFYVVAIYYMTKEGTKIAFHKHGDHDGNNNTAWTDLDSVDGAFDRIVFHNGLLVQLSNLFVLDSESISVWDFRGTNPIKTCMDFQPPEREVRQHSYQLYLVESQGELLFVEKLMNPISDQFYYDVHKLNFSACNKVECLKVERLQERCLVLSAYEPAASTSLSTLDFPELEANSIYVTQEKSTLLQGNHQLYSKVEAYNLENKGFKTIFTYQVYRRGTLHSPLLWIVPNPCKV